MNFFKQIQVYRDVKKYLATEPKGIRFWPASYATFSVTVRDTYDLQSEQDQISIKATCTENHPLEPVLHSEYVAHVHHNNVLPNTPQADCELSGIFAKKVYNMMKQIYAKQRYANKLK